MTRKKYYGEDYDDYSESGVDDDDAFWRQV